MSGQEQGHLIEYPTLIKVWGALVVLTAALVAPIARWMVPGL